MKIKFNNPFKPSKTMLGALTRAIIVLILTAMVCTIAIQAMVENNSPATKAKIKAAEILMERSETRFKECLDVAQNHDAVEACTLEYIEKNR